MRAWPLFLTAAMIGCSFPDYASNGLPDASSGEIGGLAGEGPEFDAFESEGADVGSKRDVNPEDFVYPDGGCIFPNDCGGCLPIGHTPGESCGSCGAYTCTADENNIVCTDPGRNPCGGCGPIASTPGAACGDCGKWVCSSDGNTIACNDPGKNACGGCEVLSSNPGDPCSGCSGVYQCSPEGGLQCSSGGTNACGGCSTLTNAVGGTCGVCNSGTFGCSGPEATVCNDPVTTPAPGTLCGTCKTLKYACATDGKSTLCPTPDDANDCGGCTKLLGAPGDDCGACGVFLCTTAHTLICRSPPKCLQ